jgi:hypothetical protein
MIYEFPREDYFLLKERYGCFGFTMPLYGILQGKHGLCAYIKTPFDCEAAIDINSAKKGTSGADISFIYNREKANYLREIAIYPLGGNADYTAFAKLYRKILMEENRFVSLNEKIKTNPEVEKLVGAVIWKHNTFSKAPPASFKKNYSLYIKNPMHAVNEGLPANWTAKELFDTAWKRGFDRVCVYNTGWNYGGYDSHYPTRLPPNKERGDEKEFKHDAEYARSLSEGFIYSVHDNYRDVYKNSPDFRREYLIKDKNNIPIEGDIWRGGRSYAMCPAVSIEYAKKDIPEIRKFLGRGSIYIDVMGYILM